MSSQWTFTQGLIVGQAAFLVLCLLFIRYVVFSPSEKEDNEAWRERREERAKMSTTSVPPPPPSHLLGRTGYDMATHPAESSDWINVLFAQILQGYRNDLLSAGGEEGARQRIEGWLNPPGKSMSWLDPIQVTSINLGTSFPLLSNARIRPADGQGRIRAEIDIDYLDAVSLSVSTSVLVNFPRPRFAVLPVAIGVELASVGGTLSVQMHDPAHDRQHIHVSLLPDFHLNLKTTSLLGSRAKLQDIPKLEQLIVARLRSVIQDRLVYPAHLSLALPRLLTSVPPTPIVADIANSAVDAIPSAVNSAMNLAVSSALSGLNKAFGELVDDVGAERQNRAERIRDAAAAAGAAGGVGVGVGPTAGRPAAIRSGTADSDRTARSDATHTDGGLDGALMHTVRAPVTPKKAIPIPPAFHARTYTSSTTNPAHGPYTPGLGGVPRTLDAALAGHSSPTPGAFAGGAAMASGMGRPDDSGSIAQPLYAGSASSYRPRADRTDSESLAPSQSQSQFRFRGQFAGELERRGALNSRAA
ncbi:ERMES complex subunit mmm1 [Cryptotrichosporon argae]